RNKAARTSMTRMTVFSMDTLRSKDVSILEVSGLTSTEGHALPSSSGCGEIHQAREDLRPEQLPQGPVGAGPLPEGTRPIRRDPSPTHEEGHRVGRMR